MVYLEIFRLRVFPWLYFNLKNFIINAANIRWYQKWLTETYSCDSLIWNTLYFNYKFRARFCPIFRTCFTHSQRNFLCRSERKYSNLKWVDWHFRLRIVIGYRERNFKYSPVCQIVLWIYHVAWVFSRDEGIRKSKIRLVKNCSILYIWVRIWQ